MPAGYSFRPRFWTLALAAAACAAGVALGLWQSGRAQEKRKAAAEVERMRLRGEFVPALTVLLDNKLREGRPGYEVVTPLRLAGSLRHVLVNRGWIAGGPTRAQLPEVRTPPGEVSIEGVVRERLPRVLEAGPPGRGKVRPTLAAKDFAAETGLQFEDYVLEQRSAVDDGLRRDWPSAAPGAEKNDMYALQWYSLAALAAALGVAFSFRRKG